MSEVDRLSNSGLYPALPIADKRGSNKDSGRSARGDGRPPDKPTAPPSANSADDSGPAQPRPPKSLIDEYA
jgi:hypothetical protein